MLSDTTEPVSLFDAEKQLILKTLVETDGNKSEASRRLGITRKTLQSKLNRYENNRPVISVKICKFFPFIIPIMSRFLVNSIAFSSFLVRVVF